MSRWSFVHAADLHLDSPFVGLKEEVPDLAQDLLTATFAGLRGIVDLCLEAGAEFLLLAGDLFDQPQGSLRAQLRLRQELGRLATAGIETFIVHGNHDHLEGRGVTLEWPPGVTVFSPQEVTLAEVQRRGETLARIYGMSHAGPGETENLALKFPVAPRGPLAIGLLHANLGRTAEHENYAPCTLADLARASYDYWALGHIHQPGVRREAQPTVVYAGNPQGRHLKEAGLRGCYLVEVDGHALRPKFVGAGPVNWAEARVDLSGLETVGQVLTALAQVVEKHRPQPPCQGSVVRLALEGRSQAHRELKLPGTMGEVLEELRQQGRGSRPWVWVERLQLATRPEWDIAFLSQGQDLVATLLAQIAAARALQEVPGELQQLLEPLYHHPLARRYVAMPIPGSELSELMDEVTVELLSRFQKEED